MIYGISLVSLFSDNRNSDCPKLKDEVYRLKGISRTGGRFEWLKNNQIYTVEDFLKALNKNEEKIRTVRPLGFPTNFSQALTNYYYYYYYFFKCQSARTN